MSRSSPFTRIGLFLVLTALYAAVSTTFLLRDGFTWWRVVAGMWGPGIAALVTSLVCRRRLAEFGWRPGRARYLALGYVTPMLYACAGYAVIWLAGIGGYNPRLAREIAGALGLQGYSDAVPLAIGFVVTNTLMVVIGSFAALGEEIGWRGLLVPELAKRTGFTGTALISGGIWAVWHYPLILHGALQTGEPPPWYAVSCFTLLIVAMSFPMTWLRLQSGSVWPAVIFHAVHNTVIQQYLTPLTTRTVLANYFVDETGAAMLPFAILAAVYFWRRRADSSEETHMSGASRIWGVVAGSCLVLLICGCGQSTNTGGVSTGQQATLEVGEGQAGALTGKEKGIRDAERDRENGILKLKEYPPLPYSLTDIRYIKLLKERCGVVHEVLGPGNEQELRAEAQAYNSIMTAAIRKKFGDDILARLRQEASKR
jgi:membrane protease YdiL (CAAX protease family)